MGEGEYGKERVYTDPSRESVAWSIGPAELVSSMVQVKGAYGGLQQRLGGMPARSPACQWRERIIGIALLCHIPA